MKVEEIDHIAIFVRDLDKASKFFADLLDAEFSEPQVIGEYSFRQTVEPLGIELVESTSPDGPVAKTIERKGEGVALIGFKVPNLEEAIAEMNTVGEIQLSAGMTRQAIHTLQAIIRLGPDDVQAYRQLLAQLKNQ